MGRKWSLRGENRGVSLLAVIIIVTVVGIIGVAVTQSTVTNIKMKEVERAGKANFYSAEGAVDDLSAGINIKAAEAMRKAYTSLLADYRSVMTEGSSIQKKFNEIYMNCLKEIFAVSLDPSVSAVDTLSDAGGVVYYEIGAYNADTVKGCMTDSDPYHYINCWQEPKPGETRYYHIDYAKGVFTLKDICIKFQEGAYETVVHTDIVLHTPELNFKGSNMIKGFMHYALIADRMINSPMAENVRISASVYAGEGIECGNGSKAVFDGSSIVTRGDITANSGAELTVGSTTSKIWAENVKTQGAYGSSNPAAAVINLEGFAYISDDLSLNANNSQVKIKGYYYGYNFRRDYAAVASVKENKDASFSSAILINGRNCKLDLTETGYLLLSGRSFLHQTSGDDVPLGESLSVRSNQMAYYVPSMFLDGTKFTDDNDTGYSSYIGVPNVKQYLDADNHVIKYQSEQGEVAYYLNFKDGAAANAFFAKYAEAKADTIGRFANIYAPNDALVIGDGLCTMQGDIMYRANAGDALTVRSGMQITGDWDQNDLYWSYANEIAKKYKSLQLTLEENNEIENSDIRFLDGDGKVDKTKDRLVWDQLLDLSEGVVEYSSVDPSGVYDKNQVVIVTSVSPYNVDTESCKGGIIIATGDVNLSGNFNGMIIAGGNINILGGVTVTSDVMLVSQMFNDDAAGLQHFTRYFKGYNTFSESVIGQVEIDKYLTYDNWTKTRELD